MDIITELRSITHTDVVLITVLTEFGGGVTIETVAHITGGSCGVKSVLGQLLAVKDHFQLRSIFITANHPLGTALHLTHTRGEVSGKLVSSIEIIAVQLNIHR